MPTADSGAAPAGACLCWSFVDITPDSFTWRGERSTDDGATWRLEAEFFGRRMAGAAFAR